MSDDGTEALVVIAMLGAPFSPWYARARAASHDGTADPLAFCAFNVALYRRSRGAWALVETEDVARGPRGVRIGASRFVQDGDGYRVDIDARTPLTSGRGRLLGRCRIHPTAVTAAAIPLDAAGHHTWRPLAPRARVEVELLEPSVRWSGWGYVDGNDGDEPLERAFGAWTWSRAHLPSGRSVVHYEVEARSGETRRVRRVFDDHGDTAGGLADEGPLFGAELPSTRWGLARRAASEGPGGARLVRTLEDTPFYARSLVDTDLAGARVQAVHEVLSLDRFDSTWVRTLLPFRIRRERR